MGKALQERANTVSKIRKRGKESIIQEVFRYIYLSFIYIYQSLRIRNSRGGPRIQKGGVRTFRRGGGGVRTGISGADPNCCRVLGKSTSKIKIADSRRGGGVRSPKKKPVSAHE